MDGGSFLSDASVKTSIRSFETLLAARSIPLFHSFYSVSPEERDLAFSSKCYAHYFQAVITAEGDFTFCKNTRDTTSLRMGNIISSSLSDIWNSNSMLSKESLSVPQIVIHFANLFTLITYSINC